MKQYATGLLLFALPALFPLALEAQSLGDFLNSATVKKAVTSVSGGKPVTMEALSGTWVYVKPSVRLVADNALKDVAGSVVASELEKQLTDYCTKAGITEGAFSYLFQPDGTFSCTLKGKPIKGTYTLEPEKRMVAMQFGKAGKLSLVKMNGEVLMGGDNRLSLLFHADKLLEFITKISALSDNSTLKTIGNLAEQYEGIQLGFELKR